MEKYYRARQATDDNIDACWLPKVTNTHSGYIILIDCPPQQWLYERASVLRYTYCTLPVLLADFSAADKE